MQAQAAATAEDAVTSPSAPVGDPELREHSAADYPALSALWADDADGAALGLSAADSLAGISQFFARNPGLSFALWEGPQLIGSVLAGHDGRRGYLYHLVVRADRRRHGYATLLVERAMSALAAAGIQKTHAMVYAANEQGLEFWRRSGFVTRVELVVLSRETGISSGSTSPVPEARHVAGGA